MNHYKVGIVGATGMVGQRFSLLLENRPLEDDCPHAGEIPGYGDAGCYGRR